MAKFSITIDDEVAKEVEKHAEFKGISFAEAVESLAVTAVGRLTAARRWAEANKKPKKAKVAKKVVKKAAKKASKPKAPKAEVAAPVVEAAPAV